MPHNEQVEIAFEADREEFMKILHNLTEVDPKIIDLIERKRKEAYAILLGAAMDKRIELHDGLIVRAAHREERMITAPDLEEYPLPEHYDMYPKFTAGQLKAFEKVLGLPCKNG